MIRLIYVMLLVLSFTAAAVQAKTLLILGDSLSAGYGLSQQQSWVYLLQQKLKQQDSGWTLVNASISGETSAGGLARLPALLEQHKPDYVLIELGANDGLRGFPVPQLETNLNAMVQHIRQQESEAVLMQIRIPPNYGPRYTTQFTNLYPKVAEEQQIPLWPFFMETIALKQHWMQADGLHPNLEAQPVIADLMLPLVLGLE
ncbi:arylesterase [Rheinheimera sp. 1928-s]|uniref:arylesterase n=1 Tax=Rheinheimera sp. 1928-s TaxID=3033803 RepID=UPI00262DCBE7|nr:arylesterase [Rheinheimera sp. 1928-s]MDF3126095.1 arylesterase [Rheinheimera sp. 1928-s]